MTWECPSWRLLRLLHFTSDARMSNCTPSTIYMRSRKVE